MNNSKKQNIVTACLIQHEVDLDLELEPEAVALHASLEPPRRE